MLTKEYNYLDKTILNYINTCIENKPNFDEERFNEWLTNNEIETKTNPSGYVKSCFVKELNNGRFDRQKDNDNELYVLSMQPLYNAIHKLCHIKELGDSTFFIEELNLHILKNKILTVDELSRLNHKVVEYISTFENPKPEDYCTYIRKSKVLKDKVDWEEIDRLAAKDKKEFEDLMKTFDEREKEQDESTDYPFGD